MTLCLGSLRSEFSAVMEPRLAGSASGLLECYRLGDDRLRVRGRLKGNPEQGTFPTVQLSPSADMRTHAGFSRKGIVQARSGTCPTTKEAERSSARRALQHGRPELLVP